MAFKLDEPSEGKRQFEKKTTWLTVSTFVKKGWVSEWLTFSFS